MKIYSLAVIVAMILVVSCNNSDQGETNIIYSVNLERDIDNISSIHLSNLGSKLQYIPLETNPACVIREISNLTVVDSFLFVSDNFRLLLFNKNGKFLQQIGTVGRGPGEYDRVRDFAVNSSNKEIYVLTGREVLIYNFKGHFIRNFNLGFPCFQLVLSSNDELVIHRVNIPVASESFSLYILDRYGKVKTRIPKTMNRVNGGLTISNSPLYLYNGTLYFMEFGSDTLYSYENEEIKPHIVFHPGNLKFPPDPTMEEVPRIEGKVRVSDVKETKRQLMIKIWWDLTDSTSNCVFDKSTSTFTILHARGFSNDIDGGYPFWPNKIIDDTLMVGFADAYDLIKYINSEKYINQKISSDKLKEIINNLNETSNPVIMILKP